MDGLMEKPIERVLERSLDELAGAARPRMMSLKRVASELDISVRHVQNLIEAGHFHPAQYVSGGCYSIERADVDGFAEARKRGAAA